MELSTEVEVNTQFFVAAPQRDSYRLRVNKNFCIEQPTRPNAWYRFWQRVFLGWTWESI